MPFLCLANMIGFGIDNLRAGRFLCELGHIAAIRLGCS